MNVELKKWKTEAGPRQTEGVSTAIRDVVRASKGTEEINTFLDGSVYRTLVYIMGQPSPEEKANEERALSAINNIHN